MGWKRVKERYDIRHIVHISGGNLQIGSPYISDLIVVAPDGAFEKVYHHLSGDLLRYQQAIEADPAEFARLFAEKDEFERSVPVYTYRTYKGAEIIETACEEFGWPNVTHDGQVMYDNTYFLERDKAVAAARKDAAAGLEWARERLEAARKELAKVEKDVADAEAVVKAFGEPDAPGTAA